MNVGGAETFLMKIYRTLDKTKYQMDFCLASSFKSFYEDEIISYGGRVVHIKSKSENIKSFKNSLFEIVKNNSYKYVLKITANSMGMMDLKICKKAGAEWCSVRSSNSSDQGGFKIKLMNFIGKSYLKYVDVLIAPSSLAAKYTFGKNKQYHLLHNGIDFSQFKYDERQRDKIRKEYGIGSDQFLIGHVGRFDNQKNHSFLINVFNKYHLTYPNSKLMLIGFGQNMDECQEQVKNLNLENDVLFCGQQSNVSPFLSAMDLFVLPSLYEGMPNTMIEAQANGLYCLASNTITTEANITGLCKYIPLNVSDWVISFNNYKKRDKTDIGNIFKNAGYLIDDVSREFIKLVFKE